MANGIVYADSGVAAFDANGVTNCSGTPKTCTPLWTYNLTGAVGLLALCGQRTGVHRLSSAPLRSDPGLIFMAFDANGVTNCSGTPKVCTAVVDRTDSRARDRLPAIANGKVYVADNPFIPSSSLQGDLYAWVLPPPTTNVVIPVQQRHGLGHPACSTPVRRPG